MIYVENANLQSLNQLRRKWVILAFAGIASWVGFFLWLRTWWDNPYPRRWLIISGFSLGYLLLILWQGLRENHRHHEDTLLQSLGLGNLFSITRGFILVIFCGFLFSPWPEVSWYAWLPGLLYTMAALPDFLDGAAARLTNHVTVLGETLDISIDSLGVLAVSLLSVQYGQVPWWYLPVGLARYLFLGGIWLRKKQGLPVHDLPPSVRRRGFAGLTMGLFFVILYPIFKPPGTHIAAAVFAVYLLGGFLWDWFITIGWLPTQPIPSYRKLQQAITSYLPVVLRVILAIWLFVVVLPELLREADVLLRWVEGIVLFCLVLGIAGRVAAISALIVLGIQQSFAPMDFAHLALIVVITNLLFLGTGIFSLWPVENWLIFHRVGESR